jgi:hypothetical protein
MANPRGQQRDKPFRDALRMELSAAGEDHKALRNIARKLIAKAEAGEDAAIREIADRIDGKPAQAVEMSGGLAISHEDALDELE